MVQNKNEKRVRMTSPTAKTRRQNRKPLAAIKKRTEVTKSTRAIKKPAITNKNDKPVKAIKKRTEITKSTRAMKNPAITHQNGKPVQTIRKRTEITKSSRAIKKPSITLQNKQVKQRAKKKSTKLIKPVRSSKQQHLPQRKNSLKKMPNNQKPRSKISRNSKKPTVAISKSTSTEDRSCMPLKSLSVYCVPLPRCLTEASQVGKRLATEATTSIASSMESRSNVQEKVRWPQGTQTSISSFSESRSNVQEKVRWPQGTQTSISYFSESRSNVQEKVRCVPQGTQTSISSFSPSSLLAQEDAFDPQIVIKSEEPPLNSDPRGFDRNLEPSEITDIAELGGKLFFLVKWKECEWIDVIPTKVCNERCPQLVIQFYQKHLMDPSNKSLLRT